MNSSNLFGGRKSLFGSEGSDEVVVDLNLTPLMDVMSNILFFLMASFGAAILSFMSASVPVEADPETVTTETPRTDKVIANVQIRPDGFRVNLSGDEIPRAELTTFTKSIVRTEGALDMDALTAWAVGVKKQYPASDTVVLVPSDRTVYDEIIQTMQAVRRTKLEGKKLKLLPKIVVADMVKAKAPAPDATPPPSGTPP